MPLSQFRLFFDGTPADQQRISQLSEVRVDQAIGMATEAQIQIDIGADESGRWLATGEDFIEPTHRVRVEVKVGQGEFTPLIDGTVVGQRFEMSAIPDESKLILIVQDDSVLLNRDEEVELFEDMAPQDIARQLFQRFGLTAQVDTVTSAGSGLARYIVQRGTAMQLLRELARRHGMFVYVLPGDNPGNSIGVFTRAEPAPSGHSELLLMGAERNVHRFNAHFDALRPLTARALSIDIQDQSTLTSDTQTSGLIALGDEALHTVVTPGRVLLARTREDQADLDAATGAAVDYSSWGFSADVEVVADMYDDVLQPYKTILVSGVGNRLSGEYMISRVSHVINDEQYKQQFTLRRNARDTSANTGNRAAAGGGVF